MSGLTCKDCGAGVASVDEGMMCHCRFIPWRSTTPSQVLDAATVEREARAIAEARHGVGVWNERNMNEVEQNDFRHQARAALRAAARATDPHQHGGKGA